MKFKVFICLGLFISSATVTGNLAFAATTGINFSLSSGPYVGGLVLMGLAEAPGVEPARGKLSGESGLKLKLDEDAGKIGFGIGPGRVLPDIKTRLQYNDNLTLESANEIGTFATIVSPHASYVVSDKTRRFVVDYLIEAGLHEASSTDNYVDNRLRGTFDWQPTSRIFTKFFTEFLDSHDPRGKGRAEGGGGVTQPTLDEWHHWGIGSQFAYGAEAARGRLEFETAYLNRVYDTNREVTFARDREDLSGAARFFYRVRPNTRLLMEGRITDYTYNRAIPGDPSLDSLTYRLLGGVTWDATYKTTGFAKLGFITKDFASDVRDSGSGLTWEAGVDWRPRSYSTVHFETAQSINETNGTGDSIDYTYVLAYWEHFWKERFNTRIETTYQNYSYNPDPRQDDFYEASVYANYTMRRWLTLGAGYRYQQLASSDELFDYTQNLFEITLDLAF